MAATCKTNKKMTMLFRRPSDGKVSIFLEDLEVRAAVISIKKRLGKKTFGIKGTRAPGRRIDRVFLGRLGFGPNPFEVPGRRTDGAFLGRLAFRPSPIRAFGLGRLTRGTEPRPMYPQMVFINCIFFIKIYKF